MSFYEFKNVPTPLHGVNGSNTNIDNSHVGGIPFSSNVNPNTVNPNAFPLPGNNVMSAAAKYPCPTCTNIKGGGKINRKKINKISRKYKMKGSRRTIKRRVSRLKSRVKSRYNSKSRSKSRSKRGGCWWKMKGGTCNRSLQQRGGSGPMPNYPAGYNQYQNNEAIDKIYSTGGPLSPSQSALANPPPIAKIYNDAVDNLNHNALNSFGKSGSGMGFASRGWF